LDASITARVAMYETAVNCEAFAGKEASMTTLLDNFLE
jgi:hypothetical protein